MPFGRLGLGMGFSAQASGGGAPAGLTFVQPTNLKWRWTATSPASAVDGASQATWTDVISGVQGTCPSGQPTYKANSFSGKPGIRFAGSQYFDIGRDATLLAALQADHTIMIVTSNFAAGANAIAALFCSGGIGSGNHWMVANLTNTGLYNGQQTANPMAATDLYVFYYSARHQGGSGTYMSRALGGINGTSFFSNTSINSPGTGNFTIGTGRADTVTNGNT